MLRSFEELLRDESGQTTSEYATILAIVVGIMLLVGFALRNEIVATFQAAINTMRRMRSGY